VPAGVTHGYFTEVNHEGGRLVMLKKGWDVCMYGCMYVCMNAGISCTVIILHIQMKHYEYLFMYVRKYVNIFMHYKHLALLQMLITMYVCM
jgi:hypothetical protein